MSSYTQPDENRGHIRGALLSLKYGVHQGEGPSLSLRDLEHSETLARGAGS